MIRTRVKSFAKRAINWWRRRQDTSARLARLEHEVSELRVRIEVSSAFYERRLDAALHAMVERDEAARKDENAST